MNKEIKEAWDECLKAAQRYGDYVSALSGVQADKEAMTGGENGETDNRVVGQDHKYEHDWATPGTTGLAGDPETVDAVRQIVTKMVANSKKWHEADLKGDKWTKFLLEVVNSAYADQLFRKYGLKVKLDRGSGIWYIEEDPIGGRVGDKLYETYPTYHTGGVAGEEPGLKHDEVLSKLQKGEVIISNPDKKKLYSMIDFMGNVAGRLSNSVAGNAGEALYKGIKETMGNVPNKVSNSNASITFGDVYITGTNEETIRQHKEINRKFTNEVLQFLDLKK